MIIKIVEVVEMSVAEKEKCRRGEEEEDDF